MTGLVEIARPGLLWAGAFLAAIPLLLHLLRPRERKPRRLPTTRFLTEDTRHRIRLLTRPDHLPLLALRMGLCLLLGAALAGMSWTGTSRGTVEIVVAALPPADHPDAPHIEETLTRIEATDATEIVRIDSDEPLMLAHLLRALRDHAGHLTGADSLSARLVAHPSWAAWGPGTLELRAHLWPGRISLEVPPRPEPDPASDPLAAPHPPPTIRLAADPELLVPLTRALELLGLPVHPAPTAGSPEGPTPDPSIHLRVGQGDPLGDLWVRSPPASDDPPADAGGPHFLLLDGRVIRGAGALPEGTPGAGTTVSLLRTGGRPAAAARVQPGAETRCSVALPLAADAPVLESGELPLLLDALLRESCPGALAPGPDRGLEAGAEEAWQRLLEGGERAERVEAAPLRYDGAGLPLTRLLLALALAAALGEMALARRLEARAPAPAPDEPRRR